MITSRQLHAETTLALESVKQNGTGRRWKGFLKTYKPISFCRSHEPTMFAFSLYRFAFSVNP